jgi:predicted XRE-type DNA-binding protein
MTIEEQLKVLIIKQYGTLGTFTKKIGMPQSTFATIMRRGIHRASVDNIIIICKELDISADYLAQDKIVPNDSIMKSRSVFTELTAMIEYMKMNLDDCVDFTIEGIPLSQKEATFLLDTLEANVDFLIRKREMRSL